jgi:TonB-linked SusC/RagA family outer membrane protein
MQFANAQQRTISGKVTSAEDGTGIPGVSISVKGTVVGTVTDINGDFRMDIGDLHEILIFQYLGMKTQEVEIGSGTTFNVILETDALLMEEVVVTALGITREKKSLGYATQQVDGDDINTIKNDNFINNLQGKAAGVNIKVNNNLGGSTNVIIRGSSSLTGNNQALFVVDGVPISNNLVTESGQISGRNGYDFGNAASDIPASDIESVDILKGAAATALYGSRAANGVIMITTKKGSKGRGTKRWGVNLSTSATVGLMDKSTFPAYQKDYGAGYGGWLYSAGPEYGGLERDYDINGDGELDLTVPTYEDASFGQKFDPGLMVYQYNSYDPASPKFKTATPWVAGENGADYFMQNTWSFTNSVSIFGGGEKATFRLGYSNTSATAMMVNGNLNNNSLDFSGSYEIVKGLTASAKLNYISMSGKGRNSTGYSDNILSSFRQWSQVNVDYKEQEALYNDNTRNITWNPNSPSDLAPAYWDNPYWARNQNYETDKRSRLLGYAMVDWEIDDHFSLMGRFGFDTYSYLIEDRKAIGSASGEFGVGRNDVTSGYSRNTILYSETNADFMARYHERWEHFNISVLLGTNIRRQRNESNWESTQGGLIVPGLYSLGNSIDPQAPPVERLATIGVNGYFANVSIGIINMVYVDASVRLDQSSTLPADNNTYVYPAISASFLWSELLKNSDWLQLGKLRAGYAQVGNDAPFAAINDTYFQNPSFGSIPLFSLPSTKNNVNLKPERTSSIEAGFEMTMFNSRFGFDLAYYKNNTTDQILPVSVTTATGYSRKYVNAGEIQNAGWEVLIFGAPVARNKFRWDITLNWARNVNKVVSLDEGLDNLQLASLQGGVSINARVGEPYGTIQGKDYVYNDAGQKIIGADGYYLRSSTSDNVLGNINPDWMGGINNRFSFNHNWAVSFLVDWQQGGSIFSLDQYYGLGTGLYEETVYTNDLGNPVRDALLVNDDGTSDPASGGLILDGVMNTGTEDEPVWEANTTRVHGDDYRVFGWSRNPNAAFIYSATYIKLREVVISYSLPSKMMANSKALHAVSFSLVGGNLWIISKDLPHADPEASQGAGNVQGWQSGVAPSMRTIGLTVNVQF